MKTATAKAKAKKERVRNKFSISGISKQAADQLGIKLPDQTGDKFFSPNEIGSALNVTGEAVKQWIYHRRLPAVKLANGYWQVKQSDLEAFLKRKHEVAKRRVLLACKDESIAEKIRSIGHEVVHTSSKADAILKANAVVPSLFIIDASDSDYDAWKLIKKVRESKGLRKCPIMLIGTLNDAQTDDAMKLRIQSVVGDVKNDSFLTELKQNLGEVATAAK